jgi:hypothetical protein
MKRIIIFGVWMSLLLVYTSFMKIEKPSEVKKSRCTGYTVVDAHTVQWCDGTIEKKDWQIKIGME